MVATLQDYIQDIHSWLSDYFYSKFVRDILHRITGCYVMSLRRHLSTFHFNSEIMAARKMIIDLENLQEFFDTYSEVLRRGGLKSKKNSNISAVANELEPIANLARIVRYLYKYKFIHVCKYMYMFMYIVIYLFSFIYTVYLYLFLSI
jgi:hypothetical protein